MRVLFVAAFCLLIACAIPSLCFAQRPNVSEILDKLFQGYDRRIRPNFGAQPVEVNITMYILGISSVSERHMEYTMDLYFREFWTDERLRFYARPGLDSIVLDGSSGVSLWEPDTFFANERKASLHGIITPNVFIRIKSDGKITKSQRLSVTATCPMNLKYFPMDSQVCGLEMESYGFKASDIYFKWGKGENSVGISPEVELPQFRVVGHRINDKTVSLSTGTYSRLGLEIQLSRTSGYYAIQVYIPVAMIVIMSWIAFLLENRLIRIVIGLLTTLTLLTFLSSVNASLPKIAYVKLLDVYLGISMLMVFAALVVHALVEYLASSARASAHSDDGALLTGRADKNTLDLAVNADPEGHSRPSRKWANLRGLTPSRIDKFSLIGFPVVYFVFNIIYCIVSSSVSGDTVDNLIEFKHN